MKKTLSLIIVIGFCVLFAQETSQESRQGQDQQGQQRQRVRLSELLNLTPQQQEEFSRIRRETAAANSENYANLRSFRNELLTLSAADTVDTARIRQVAEEIGRTHTALSLNTVENIRAIREILSQEQFETFIEHRKSRNMRNLSRNRVKSKQN